METPDVIKVYNERYYRKHYPEFAEMLERQWSDLPFIERLWLWDHDMVNKPVCAFCGGSVPYLGWKRGYQRCCSIRCACSMDDYREKKRGPMDDASKEKANEKRKATVRERYGTDNVFQNDDIKRKISESIHKNYGVDRPLQNKDLLTKAQQTLQKNYGVGTPMESPELKVRARLAQEKKYGGVGFASPELAAKTRHTMMERYGTENIMHSREFHMGVMEGNDNIIGFADDGRWICKCPHIECNKCKEKTYITDSGTYHNRMKSRSEQCTTLLPPGLYGKDTTIEQFVKRILDREHIEYICNDRTVISPKELDIYIPEKHIAIECNGVYFHSSEFKRPKDHWEKYNACQEKGIQLLTLWQDQIINSPDVVESILLSKLGVYDMVRWARRCEVREVERDVCEEFLRNYHLQGSTRSGVMIGLWCDGELLCVMTFGKGRFKRGDSRWEMYRYCSKRGVRVVGGAGKMLDYFIKTYHPGMIVSFSSNDISDGGLYRSLGFEKSSESVGYWYVKGMKRYHRYVFRKSELIKTGADPERAESEIMKERGYLKIYDSGQTKWIKHCE